MQKLMGAALFGLALSMAVATSAAAAPITCPNGHTVVKTDAGWTCQNTPNQGDPNTEETKNPND